MYAVISDIHSNLTALKAVLADIDSLAIDEIICLGDVVGYGPDPLVCADLIRERVAVTVKGNHDEALLQEAYGFSSMARQAIDWTRDALKPGFFSGPTVHARWEWLASLPLRYTRGPDLFVHGSPRDPTSEYLLMQELAFGYEKYDEVFASVERLLFVGHTHQPCVITDRFVAHKPEELDGIFRFGTDLCDAKAIVNVGSVGQPRDGDRRACYVVVDETRTEPTVTWRRVPYAVEETARKIGEVEELDDRLGERLKLGR